MNDFEILARNACITQLSRKITLLRSRHSQLDHAATQSALHSEEPAPFRLVARI